MTLAEFVHSIRYTQTIVHAIETTVVLARIPRKPDLAETASAGIPTKEDAFAILAAVRGASDLAKFSKLPLRTDAVGPRLTKVILREVVGIKELTSLVMHVIFGQPPGLWKGADATICAILVTGNGGLALIALESSIAEASFRAILRHNTTATVQTANRAFIFTEVAIEVTRASTLLVATSKLTR